MVYYNLKPAKSHKQSPVTKYLVVVRWTQTAM